MSGVRSNSGSNFNCIMAVLGHEPIQSLLECFILNYFDHPFEVVSRITRAFSEIVMEILSERAGFFSQMDMRDNISNLKLLFSQGKQPKSKLTLSLMVIVPVNLLNNTREVKPVDVENLIRQFMQNESGFRYYWLDPISGEIQSDPMGNIVRHPLYHSRVLFERPFELLPDSPAQKVLYSDRLPIHDLGHSLKPISRLPLSWLISFHRGEDRFRFRFRTGVESFLPEYGKLLFRLSRKSLVFLTAIGLHPAVFKTVQSLLEVGAWHATLASIQEKLAICFMGEPVGFGLFNGSLKTIPMGAFLGVYEGQLTSNMTYRSKDAVLVPWKNKKGHSENFLMSSQFKGGYIGLANHSAENNAIALPLYFENTLGQVFQLTCLFSHQRILPFEQITWNYGDKYLFGSGGAFIFDRYGREIRKGKEVIRDSLTGFELD